MEMRFATGEEYIVINRTTGEVNYWVSDEKGYFSKWAERPSTVGRK